MFNQAQRWGSIGAISTSVLCACAAPAPEVAAAPAAGVAAAGNGPHGEIRFEDASAAAGMVLTDRKKSADPAITAGEFPGAKTEAGLYAWPFDVAFADVNGDGHADLFMLNHAHGAWSRLWLGDGKGKWQLVSPDKMQADGKSRGSFSLLGYDFTGAGPQDLLMTDGDVVASQYHFTAEPGTRAPEAFTWVKEPLHGAIYTYLLADFNGDGNVDAAVGANRGAGGGVYFGNGGAWIRDFTAGPQVFVGFHSAAADMNGDGWPDIVASDFGETKTARDFYIGLLINDGKGGFTDKAAEAGLDAAPAGGAILLADFNNDGLMDIYLCGYNSTKKDEGAVKLYLNQGNGKFKDATEGSGLEGLKAVWGTRYVKVACADFDNDGLVDIVSYASGGYHVYQNLGGGKFKEVTDSAGVPPDNTGEPCAAAADYDEDGLVDLTTLHHGVWLGHNVTQTKNGWLEVKLRGPKGNPEAAGASVTLYAAGHLGETGSILGHQQAIFSTDQHTTGSKLHFGLGTVATCDLRATFPGGKMVELKDVKARGLVEVKQP